MTKLRVLAGLLAAAFTGSVVAADGPVPDTSGYYVVVPLGPMRALTAAAGIEVSLGSSALPPGLVGIQYDGFDFKPLLKVTGDAGYTGYGVKWSVASGALPEGLTLNPDDGTVSGTPTANGTATFQVRATYKTKTGDNEYQIFVGKIEVAIAAGNPPQAIAGQFYSYDLKPLLSVTGDSSYKGEGAGVTWTVVSSSLPAGLTLRADGTISGTPLEGGGGTITARASYRGSNGEQTYELMTLAIKVSLAAAAPPQAIVGQEYSYDLKALLSVTGDSAYNGGGVTWTALSDNLPAGLTLRPDGTVAGMPTAAGKGFLTVRASYRGVNDEQAYEVVTLAINVILATATPPQAIVGQAYSYDLKNLLSVTGDNAYNGSGVTWSVVADTLPAGISLKADGTIAGTPTAAGSGKVTARATYRNVSGQQVYQVVTLDIKVSLAAGTPPQAIVGQAYTYDLKNLLTVTGDNAYNGSGVTWAVVSSTLPEGITLRANGTIAGTPTKAGAGAVTARATYRNEKGEQTYQVVTLDINVILAAGTPPQAIVGQAYSYNLKPLLSVTGDSAYAGTGVTWSAVSSTLPAGLSLAADGTITGTPTAAGTGSLVARATYRGENGEQTYEVVALNIVVSLAAGSPPQAIVGQAYDYDLKPLLSVTGDNAYTGANVTWTVVSSTLPAGLYLRTDGSIGGTPTASGTGTITARATYRGVNGQQAYQVVTLGITVSLANATPPQAIVGQSYSYDLKPLLTVSGDPAYNGAGVTWTVVASTLPAGLTLRSDGTITGTPTAAGTGTVTARATYRGVNGDQAYQVVTLNITVALATATPPQAILGQAYSYDLKPLLTVTGDNAYNGSGVTWTVLSNSLPAGLSLKADGTISGTPTASGTGTITARATYRNVNGQQTYQVVTLNIVVTLATATLPQAIAGQVYNYDLKPLLTVTGDNAYNGSGVTWTTLSGSLPAGLSLRTDGTIGGTPTASGTGSIVVRAAYRGNNGQQTYQVVALNITVTLAAATAPQAIVGQAYSYDLKPLLTVSGDSAYNGTGVTWTVVSTSLPTGLTLKSDGTIGGTPTASGSGTITARATYRGVNGQQTYQIVSLNITVALATGTAPQAIVGQAYSYDLKPLLTVSGDSAYNGSGVTWTVVSNSLAAGLYLRNDGTIVGTPTAAGTGTITARATYRGVDGQQTYQVVTLGITVTLAAGSPPQAIVGQAYSYNIKSLLTVSGDPAYNGSGVTWSTVSGTLPAGLSLAADGTISGTPTASGTGTITARATYRGVNGDQAYQVVSLNITVALATATLPQAIVGQAYSYDVKPLLTVSGDSAYNGSGVTWSTVSGALPAGLTLRADGTIGGTPTASGTGSIVARATYRNVNGQQTYSVVSLNITVSLATGSAPEAIVGQAYSYDLKPLLTVSGDSAYSGTGVTWTLVSGTLPAGLTLRADGTIGGTPTASGTGSIVARASYRGVNGQQTYQVVSLGITVALAAGTPPQAIVGQAYSYDLKPLLTVSGDGSYNGSGVTWGVVSGTLPAGLTLRTDGTIGGTPTAAGSVSITARATYRNVYGDRVYQVVSLNITVSLAAATPPQARVGESYSHDLKPYLTVSGDSAYTISGVTWSTVASTLPAGLSLTTAGVVSGTPTVATTGSITARATYRNVSGQQAYSIVTQPAYTFSWLSTGWSTPAACGSTTSTRTVYCQRSDGTTVADASCTGTKPATTQAATDYSSCTYSWSSTGWSVPAACGSTTATRSVSCLRSDGTTVADASCTGTKPATTQAATDYSSCTFSWNATGWSTPAACGSTTSTRTVYCQRSDGTTVADASCSGAKPAATQAATDYSSCTYSWNATGWSTPAACGSTTSTRTVWCQRSDGATVADASCGGAKPATTQGATDYSSCSYTWNATGWSTPAACGSTTATRTVYCQRSDGATVADASCGGAKPASTTPTTDYSSCSYSWASSGWSVPAACGSTTASRSVWCQRSDGSSVSDAYCGGGKPSTTTATTDYSTCSYSNSYGSWGSCSVSCGGGTQYRSATCMRSDGTAVSSAYCSYPTTSQSCNTQACYSYSWSTGGWSTPNGCGTVTSTRSVSCVRSDGVTMSDAYCSGTKPATTQSDTNYNSCSYSYNYGAWGGCTASCGGGVQYRWSQCVRSDGAVVDGSACGGNPTEVQSCNTQACAPTTGTWSANYTGNCQSFSNGSIKSGSCSPIGATNSAFVRTDKCVYRNMNTPYENLQQTCQ